jgi:hypothetical protein
VGGPATLARAQVAVLRCHHADGPLAGEANDVSLASPRTPRRLQWAPAPTPAAAITPAGYFVVGYDDELVDDDLLDELPGTVTYELDRAASRLRAHPEYDGMEQGVAVYRQA